MIDKDDGPLICEMERRISDDNGITYGAGPDHGFRKCLPTEEFWEDIFKEAYRSGTAVL